MVTVSIIIITSNAEDDIKRCLESISWAYEIILVDCFSQDKTAEIAKEYTDKVWQREWQGYGKQKNFAIDKARGDWIFWIDSDEVVTQELVGEIKNIISQDKDISAYYVPRRTYFLNHWIKHCGWYPGYTLRLFKKGVARFNERLVHERLDFKGKAGYFNGDLLHYSYKSISEYVDRLNKYTSLEAKQMVSEGKNIENIKLVYKIITNPITTFCKMYFRKKGFKDGIYGLMLCILSSIYKLVLYVKYWQYIQKSKK